MRLLEISPAELYAKYFANKLTPEEFNKLVAIDPTSTESVKGLYLNWLIQRYLKHSEEDRQRFLEEDAPDLRKGLEIFQKLTKNKEGIEKLEELLPDYDGKNIKDINTHTEASILRLARQIETEDLESADVKLEKRITVLYNGPALFMCIPLTHEAARKYGTGTNWCTATSNDTYFYNYTKQGPLFIIINKQDQREKYQVHGPTNQFRDKNDAQKNIFFFIEDMQARSPDFENDVAAIATILAKEYHIRAWSREVLLNYAVSRGVDGKIKQVFNGLRTQPRSKWPRMRFKGLSAIGALLAVPSSGEDVDTIYQYDYAVRQLIDAGVRPIPQDIVASAYYPDRMQTLLSYSDNQQDLIIAAVEAAVDAPSGNRLTDMFAILYEDNIALLEQFAAALATLDLEQRAFLCFQKSRPLFSSHLLQSMARFPDRQKFFIFRLFPELDTSSKIKEARLIKEAYISDEDIEAVRRRNRARIDDLMQGAVRDDDIINTVEKLRATLAAIFNKPAFSELRNAILGKDDFDTKKALKILKYPYQIPIESREKTEDNIFIKLCTLKPKTLANFDTFCSIVATTNMLSLFLQIGAAHKLWKLPAIKLSLPDALKKAISPAVETIIANHLKLFLTTLREDYDKFIQQTVFVWRRENKTELIPGFVFTEPKPIHEILFPKLAEYDDSEWLSDLGYYPAIKHVAAYYFSRSTRCSWFEAPVRSSKEIINAFLTILCEALREQIEAPSSELERLINSYKNMFRKGAYDTGNISRSKVVPVENIQLIDSADLLKRTLAAELITQTMSNLSRSSVSIPPGPLVV